MINDLTFGEENGTSTDEEEDEDSIMDSLITNNDDSDDGSPAEDFEAFINDAGVWHTMKVWTEKHDCSLLDSFKFFF